MSREHLPDRTEPYFRAVEQPRPGLDVIDPIEGDRTPIRTGIPVEPTPVEPTDFPYPLDSTVEFCPEQIEWPDSGILIVRDLDGSLVEKFGMPSERRVSFNGEYIVEGTSTLIKNYSRVLSGEFTIRPAGRPGGSGSVIDLPSPQPVRVGVRSHHTQPARAIETTGEPADLMAAVSRFGNAMKTWAPERSYPTLRGHPPLFEFTNDPDRSDVPPPPATDIRLTVPPEYEWVFPTTPLAYWLGATVEPGPPALHLDGVRYPLGTEAGYDGQTGQQAFERHVQDVLQVTFYCEGTARKWYDYTTKTEQQLKDAGLSVDFEALYERPVAERTWAYLQAAPGVQTVAEMVSAPRWPLEAYIEPTAEQAPALPFLSRDLATIRTADETALERGPDLEAVRDDDAQMKSSGVVSSTPFRGAPPKTLRPSRSTDTDADSPSGAARYATPLVSLPETGGVTPVWVGEGFAADAFNVSTAAYQHRLVEQSGENDGAISVDVIINDREMADEAAVSELYGDRERLPFEVTLHDEQDRAGLATIFEQNTDFIHYVGHVDPDGFRCADGHLGGDEFGRVGTTTFLLNACCSYEQGCRLIENGAVSGIVTLNDVLSPLATEIGKTAAQLLNHGYPIDATTHLIRELEAAGHYYGMVGDPKATVAQYQSGAPEIARISITNDGAFSIWSEAVTNAGYRLGCVMSPFFPDDCHYLCPDTLGPWRVEDDQAVAAYLQSEHIAAPIDGELYWTEDLTIADLRELLEAEDE